MGGITGKSPPSGDDGAIVETERELVAAPGWDGEGLAADGDVIRVAWIFRLTYIETQGLELSVSKSTRVPGTK